MKVADSSPIMTLKYALKKIPASIMAILLSSLILSPSADAYDVDTHFYGTYSMARFVGIKHEVAAQIAMYTQWMDESYVSDPVSMIIVAETGVKKRRLLHFPGSRLANKLTVDTLPFSFYRDPSSGARLRIFTETVEEDDFATEMFTEGLMKGSFLEAAVGLHTLEDSFAHAGTISELGHAHFWHHPDRPSVDAGSVEKYFKMTHAVIKALVAIRSLLPANALDHHLTIGTTLPNSVLDAETLSLLYSQNPIVRTTISRDVLKDPRYVNFALHDIFKRAEKADYVKSGYENYLSRYSPGNDTYQATAEVLSQLPSNLIDFATISKETGHSADIGDADYIKAENGIQNFMRTIIDKLLVDIVPRRLDMLSHSFEKSEEGPIREKEMQIRISDMKDLIENLYHTKVQFIKNQSKTFEGSLRELRIDPTAAQEIKNPDPEIMYVTPTLAQKAEFDHMIFAFLFPKLSQKYTFAQIDALANMLEIFDQLITQDLERIKKTLKIIEEGNILDDIKSVFLGGLETQQDVRSAVVKIYKSKVSVLSLVADQKLAKEDLLGSHMVANKYNKYYAQPDLLKKYTDNHTFKQLLSDKDVSALPRSATSR